MSHPVMWCCEAFHSALGHYSEVPNKRSSTFINFGDFVPPLRTLLGPLRLLNLANL